MKPRAEAAINNCDVCGSNSARELYTATDRLSNTGVSFTIAQCEGCGVLRTLPPMSDAEISTFYPEDYWGAAAEPSQRWIQKSQAEKKRFLANCNLHRGSILDVGCGSGFFLRALDSALWDRFGVETSESASQAAERAIGSGRVFNGTFIESTWPDSRFDVVTLWSALEHTNEPRGNLVEARRILKTGGSLIVQLPNAASYQARAFGGLWFALDTPRHRYHFTFPILERLLMETGFEVYRVSYFSRNHNWHALKQSLKSKLLRNSSLSNRALFYLTLPFAKPFDSLMSALGRGATLTVASRALSK